jgi:hypothetical protein
MELVPKPTIYILELQFTIFGGLSILFFNWSLVLKLRLELGHKRPRALAYNLDRIWKGLVFIHFSFHFIIVMHSTTTFSIKCKMEVEDTSVEEFKLMKYEQLCLWVESSWAQCNYFNALLMRLFFLS